MAGWQELLTPPPLLAASFLRPHFARLHAPFTSSPPPPARTVHAPPLRAPWHAPPAPDPECTRLSPGPGPRAVFLPPYFPHPPGAAGAPTLGPGPGSAQARGCTGRARGAGSAWASGGRGGGGSCRVFQAPRAAAAASTLGGGRGEGIKGAGVPPSRPPFQHQPPHTVKGPESLASPLAGIICPPERKYVPSPSSPLPPPRCLRARRPVCACVPSAAAAAPPRPAAPAAAPRPPARAPAAAPRPGAGLPAGGAATCCQGGTARPSSAQRRVAAAAPGRPSERWSPWPRGHPVLMGWAPFQISPARPKLVPTQPCRPDDPVPSALLHLIVKPTLLPLLHLKKKKYFY